MAEMNGRTFSRCYFGRTLIGVSVGGGGLGLTDVIVETTDDLELLSNLHSNQSYNNWKYSKK